LIAQYANVGLSQNSAKRSCYPDECGERFRKIESDEKRLLIVSDDLDEASKPFAHSSI
jgi:hypothetical protein